VAELRRGPDGNRRFHHELAVIRARRAGRSAHGDGGGDRGAWRGTQALGSGGPESRRRCCSTSLRALLVDGHIAEAASIMAEGRYR